MEFGLFYLMQRDEQWSEEAVYDSDVMRLFATEVAPAVTQVPQPR